MILLFQLQICIQLDMEEKKAQPRVYFAIRHDLTLLREAVGCNVWANPEKWPQVKETLDSEMNPTPSMRAIKDRLASLIKKHKAGQNKKCGKYV